MRVFLDFLGTVRTLLSEAQFRAAATLLAGLVISGTIVYSFLEGWSLLDSLCFCVVTSATVGYGDLTPTTDLGRLVTVVYILTSVGLLVALLSRVATGMIDRRIERSAAQAAMIQVMRERSLAPIADGSAGAPPGTDDGSLAVPDGGSPAVPDGGSPAVPGPAAEAPAAGDPRTAGQASHGP
jgi:hypothetical protein